MKVTATLIKKKKLEELTFESMALSNNINGGVLQNSCSEKFHKIFREIPVTESFFNKVAGWRFNIQHYVFVTLPGLTRSSCTFFLWLRQI